MQDIAKWLPSLLAAVSAAVVAVSPEIQDYLSQHPLAVSILASLSVIIAHILPSPVPPPQNGQSKA